MKNITEQSENEDNGILNFSPRQPKLQEGIFHSRINQFEIIRNSPTKYGLRCKVVFHFTVFLNEGSSTEEIKQSYLASNYQGSMFNTFIETLLGRPIGQSVDLNELKGKECLVKITHNTNEQGDVFENVEYVRKVGESLSSGRI